MKFGFFVLAISLFTAVFASEAMNMDSNDSTLLLAESAVYPDQRGLV